ncbi:uncharacterized protein LOC111362343 [Spodoptera litura]|uniref:Uncharacterized protein LOC111362343 n=1 Tax=Spodoptera litura TaxID=69820 RepID=A0A9J7ET01_SPOLT|nr:uncharacterized protein LOC111362343 [Spodoptera litura]
MGGIQMKLLLAYAPYLQKLRVLEDCEPLCYKVIVEPATYCPLLPRLHIARLEATCIQQRPTFIRSSDHRVSGHPTLHLSIRGLRSALSLDSTLSKHFMGASNYCNLTS